ncbi:MAG: hypothetical protein ACREJ0_25905 [Geminicoccaceae bacterium]
MTDKAILENVHDQEMPGDLIYRHYPLQPRSFASKVKLEKSIFHQDYQTFSVDLNLEPWVFVDNADPAIRFLHILLRIDARFSPGSIARPRSGKGPYFGLYQALFSIDVTPSRPVGDIAWQRSRPETVNQQVTKTESTTDTMSFNVGYKSGGASRTWTYQTGRSYTISEWNIVETGNGNRMGWRFWQGLPWDGVEGASESDVRRVPHLSEYSAQVHAQGIWRTSSILEEPVRFDILMRQLPQMTWGYETGLAIPIQDAAAPRITDAFELDFSGLDKG